MIAAARRRIRAAHRRLRGTLIGHSPIKVSRRLDRAGNRALEWAHPRLARAGRRAGVLGAKVARRLRPAGAFLFRALSWLEKRLLRGRALAAGAATRASAVLTPERAVCVAILAAAVCLGVSQFVEYRAVEVGQPGYAGLPGGAAAPTVAGESAGSAHAYLLLPLALLAAVLALAVLRNGARRGLGRIVFALGAVALAVALLVDLPAGLDAAAEEARFAGATAVLENGFYAEVASAVGMMIGGLILAGRHRYRLRKPSLARTQGGRRRERTV
jgi:hypothetical protein